jgi:hypothetical protein
MKQRPILFSTPMVQAIMDGRKTMTRRIAKDKMLQDNKNEFYDEEFLLLTMKQCPFGQVGDVLWVRETFCSFPNSKTLYKANGCIPVEPYKWKPSIFMPKDACRIFLKITNTRVERLMDISREDARAEGVERINGAQFKNYVDGTSTYNERTSFYSLWESINGKDSVSLNPFVWVIEFERIEKPE